MSLSDFSDLSQIIIAVANLFLAGYVLLYQIRKDKRTELDAAHSNEQNIKLQWIKELIVQPNIPFINHFYERLHSIKEKITTDNLTTEERETINNMIKQELSLFRKTFIDVLLQIDKAFAFQVLKNLDQLIDDITEAIFNDELKLSKLPVYEKHIGSKIAYSKNNLIALLYNYKGLPAN